MLVASHGWRNVLVVIWSTFAVEIFLACEESVDFHKFRNILQIFSGDAVFYGVRL